jgi:hypothetical protein
MSESSDDASLEYIKMPWQEEAIRSAAGRSAGRGVAVFRAAGDDAAATYAG